MLQRADQQPVTIERLERALLVVAYCIELDGPIHAPLYESLERDLFELRKKQGIVERARARIDAHTLDGGRKAIA